MWITHPFGLHLWRIDKIENQKKDKKQKQTLNFWRAGGGARHEDFVVVHEDFVVVQTYIFITLSIFAPFLFFIRYV